MTKITSTYAASAIVGGVAVLAALFAVVPASQADTGWRVRQPSPPTMVMTYFDSANDLVRFYVGGKEVAILNGAGVEASHPNGR